MGLAGGAGSGSDQPTKYDIPNYEKYAHKVVLDSDGHDRNNYAHNQRFEYINVNVTGRNLHNYTGDISLLNLVTTAHVTAPEPPPPPTIEQKGGLYFTHGYDAHTPKDIVSASGYENVDLDGVAATLIQNQTFELKITAHADTSGDADKNLVLSENRRQTAETLLIAALKRQGLSDDEAQAIYKERVIAQTTFKAEGETNGPVATQDDTRHQGNRVVTFDLITKGSVVHPEGEISKGEDLDNHEHLIVVNLGTKKTRSELDLFPEDVGRRSATQFGIADEDVKFIFRIDPDRKLDAAHQFTTNFWTKTNQVADNTTFLIESDQPGAVTSAYNFQTGKVDISLNGQVAVSISTRDHIDPALIRVGQVTSQGQVTVSPLTNLADVEPISESRRKLADSSPLTVAADKIVQLSVEAKHLYMAHPGDEAGFQAALKDSGFAEKVDQALQELTDCGLSTGPLKRLLTNSYANPQSALYNPDQLVFPFQTFQGLYESEVSARHIQPQEGADPYKVLSERLSQLTVADLNPSKPPLEQGTALSPPPKVN